MYDILIKDARIVDGTGRDAYSADIGISGDRISKIGQIPETEGKRLIRADGLLACPGFVDVHSHSDYYLLINPLAESKVRQGVTTEIGGNCGYSAAPINGDALAERKESYKKLFGLDHDWKSLEEYYKKLETQGISLNFGILIGHNTIRASVMGGKDKRPSEKELDGMIRMVHEGMREGGLGLSTGLAYAPACFAEKKELISLCKITEGYGGLFATHMRSEGDGLIEALQEVISVAQETGIPLQVSHLKTSGKRNWSKLDMAFKVIEKGQERGIDITCDRYPYTAANTGLHAVFPNWVLEGGTKKEIARLKDPSMRSKIIAEVTKNHPEADYWDNILISQVTTEANRKHEGKSIKEAANHSNKEVWEFLFGLLIEEEAMVEAIFFTMSEDNLLRIFKKPYVMIGSDSGARAHYGALGEGVPHPRTFGTFPRVLGRYVRDKGVFDIPTAIKKMTSEPCRKFGIHDRGKIAEGYYADIVLFDHSSINDRATYGEPKLYPEGIKAVIVNGSVTVKDSEHLGVKAGKIIRRKR